MGRVVAPNRLFSLVAVVRLGLEDRRAVEPQTHIMAVRFLGELFRVQLVDSRLVFDTL